MSITNLVLLFLCTGCLTTTKSNVQGVDANTLHAAVEGRQKVLSMKFSQKVPLQATKHAQEAGLASTQMLDWAALGVEFITEVAGELTDIEKARLAAQMELIDFGVEVTAVGYDKAEDLQAVATVINAMQKATQTYSLQAAIENRPVTLNTDDDILREIEDVLDDTPVLPEPELP